MLLNIQQVCSVDPQPKSKSIIQFKEATTKHLVFWTPKELVKFFFGYGQPKTKSGYVVKYLFEAPIYSEDELLKKHPRLYIENRIVYRRPEIEIHMSNGEKHYLCFNNENDMDSELTSIRIKLAQGAGYIKI